MYITNIPRYGAVVQLLSFQTDLINIQMECRKSIFMIIRYCLIGSDCYSNRLFCPYIEVCGRTTCTSSLLVS